MSDNEFALAVLVLACLVLAWMDGGHRPSAVLLAAALLLSRPATAQSPSTVARLLAVYPHGPHHACVVAHTDRIDAQLAEAESVYGVPPSLLAAVAWHETHLGCAGEADWGAPVSRAERHSPGNHLHAARALATGYRVCGTWPGAVLRFHRGLCAEPVRTSHPEYWRDALGYVRAVLGTWRRIGGAP